MDTTNLPPRNEHGQFTKPDGATDDWYRELRDEIYKRLAEEYAYEARTSFTTRSILLEIARTQALLADLDARLERVGGAVRRDGGIRAVALLREKMAGRVTRLYARLPRRPASRR